MANKEPSWMLSIMKVLEESGEAMHYSYIAEEIVRKKLRTKVGATPAASVSACIITDINKNGEKSTFIRVEPGKYILRGLEGKIQHETVLKEDAETLTSDDISTEIIKAFGMYWRRNLINWNSNVKLLGKQSSADINVNFYSQKGVYLLHDHRGVVYVGRAIDQPLGQRLFQHTSDRLNGRWDRFSWFGVCGVKDDGKLMEDSNLQNIKSEVFIATMESLLIESLEPPQNRKRGDDFNAIEYLQVEDPQIKKKQISEFMNQIQSKLDNET